MAFSLAHLLQTGLEARTGHAQASRARDLEDAELARQEATQKRLQDQLLFTQDQGRRDNAREDTLLPLRQRLLKAQAGDEEAAAAGTGRYAPKPVAAERPRRTFKTNANGQVVAIDEDTLKATPVEGVRERVPSSGGGPDQGLKFNEIARLRNEFAGYAKPYQVAKTAITQMDALSNDQTGASDIQLLYAAVKAADPESVVREGEIALQRLASNYLDTIGINVQKFLGGRQVLTPAQRSQLVAAAKTRFGPTEASYKQKRDYYGKLTKGFGADPFEVVGPDDEPAAQDPNAPPALNEVLKMGQATDRPALRNFIESRRRPQ